MPTVLFLRHGRSAANTSGRLAGWSPGVHLDERGLAQAAALPDRLAGVPLARIVTSPLERCRQTLAPLLERAEASADGAAVPVAVDERLGECHYGDWTGREIKELAKDPLWPVVQQHPSAARFPGEDGETLRAMQQRAVEAVRDWNERVTEEHGPDAVYLVCTHGDVIKALLADALGMHLDLFQRIAVDPCSISAVRYTPMRPFLLRAGDTGRLADLVPPPPPPAAEAAETAAAEEAATPDASGDAVVGGGAGGA
ncbi:histidine phosphatase family protein [Allostreptomyces psammosilenae]|uniref:Putative phosphomutase (TIGR03848 family) n=1 Tax=Allostreptomyces psammosilenae TaxID=1892865 RepID=A0A852ZZE4_9ACTN|nr:histidine phosphatase family protein [Allostreptomyces psammosilenae]NYI03961.1 putative phosphomutase (TIGR03848 family) [Allostreptomyces psammosilenae]